MLSSLTVLSVETAALLLMGPGVLFSLLFLRCFTFCQCSIHFPVFQQADLPHVTGDFSAPDQMHLQAKRDNRSVTFSLKFD